MRRLNFSEPEFGAFAIDTPSVCHEIVFRIFDQLQAGVPRTEERLLWSKQGLKFGLFRRTARLAGSAAGYSWCTSRTLSHPACEGEGVRVLPRLVSVRLL